MKLHDGLDNTGRPYSFLIGEHEYIIREIVDQWFGGEHQFYKVRADDGNIYILKHSFCKNLWELEFFQNDRTAHALPKEIN